MRSGLRPEPPPNLPFASLTEECHGVVSNGVFGQVLPLNGNLLYGDFAAVAVRVKPAATSETGQTRTYSTNKNSP